MFIENENNSQTKLYIEKREEYKQLESKLFAEYKKQYPNGESEIDNYLQPEWGKVCNQLRDAEAEIQSWYNSGWTPVVGEGVTEIWYTDTKAYTIISVSPSGKSFKIQRDKTTRLDDPNIEVGGFSGHCTNNTSIRYSYERDTEGEIKTVRKTKTGWKTPSNKIRFERSEFYDYNF